jgi:hypothetical protein
MNICVKPTYKGGRFFLKKQEHAKYGSRLYVKQKEIESKVRRITLLYKCFAPMYFGFQ